MEGVSGDEDGEPPSEPSQLAQRRSRRPTSLHPARLHLSDILCRYRPEPQHRTRQAQAAVRSRVAAGMLLPGPAGSGLQRPGGSITGAVQL